MSSKWIVVIIYGYSFYVVVLFSNKNEFPVWFSSFLLLSRSILHHSTKVHRRRDGDTGSVCISWNDKNLWLCIVSHFPRSLNAICAAREKEQTHFSIKNKLYSSQSGMRTERQWKNISNPMVVYHVYSVPFIPTRCVKDNGTPQSISLWRCYCCCVTIELQTIEWTEQRRAKHLCWIQMNVICSLESVLSWTVEKCTW